MANRVIPTSFLPEPMPISSDRPSILAAGIFRSVGSGSPRRILSLRFSTNPGERRPIVSTNSETNIGAPTIIRGGVNERWGFLLLEEGENATWGSAIIEEREWVTRERFANSYVADCETSVIPPTIFCFTPERVRSSEVRS